MKGSRPVIVFAFLAAIFVSFHPSARTAALSVLRLPFTLTAGVIRAVLLVPSLPSLANENAQLRDTVLRQQLELAQVRERLRESQETEGLTAKAPEIPHVMARIIGRSPLPTQQTVLINKGQRDGLFLEAPVVDADGVVGRVQELHLATSWIALITDAESRVAARIERTRETGILVGREDGACQLLYLEDDADVAVGDAVVTAGIGGRFPPGLLLGTVTDVHRDPVVGSAMAKVQPAVRLGRLEHVLCLLTEKTEE